MSGMPGFEKDSFIYIDPRTKFILLVLCSFAALRESRLLYQGLLFLLAYLLLLNGRQFVYARKIVNQEHGICMNMIHPVMN